MWKPNKIEPGGVKCALFDAWPDQREVVKVKKWQHQMGHLPCRQPPQPLRSILFSCRSFEVDDSATADLSKITIESDRKKTGSHMYGYLREIWGCRLDESTKLVNHPRVRILSRRSLGRVEEIDKKTVLWAPKTTRGSREDYLKSSRWPQRSIWWRTLDKITKK